MFKYEVIKVCAQTGARIETITPHGEIGLLPVGTMATVKSLSPEEHGCGNADNTFQYLSPYLRPGHKIIEKAGGLHKFMNWHKPILTDSGGFQIFSLSSLRKSATRVLFNSFIDGASIF